MQPVLNTSLTRQADERTLLSQRISSHQLMERAAIACTKRIIDIVQNGSEERSSTSFAVFAGRGNNGGDGLAIARILANYGYDIRAFRMKGDKEPSPENSLNWDRLLEIGVVPVDVDLGSEVVELIDHEVIIDAVLGVGVTRAVSGSIKAYVDLVNSSKNHVVAIDLPTGLGAEGRFPTDLGSVIHAGDTLCIGALKLPCFLPDLAPFMGNWHLIPIDLDFAELDPKAVQLEFIEEHDVAQLLKHKGRFSHKGSYGHAFMIAGSVGKVGAAIMAIKASLRSGCGLVTAAIPGKALEALQLHAPEAMCFPDSCSDHLTDLPVLTTFTAVGIGPGLGSDPDTKLVFKRLIQTVSGPLVIDADALNMLSEERTWLAFLPPNSILTPHPREFDRLIGTLPKSSFERLKLAREFALKNQCILVLKGAYTAVCLPNGKAVFNSTGNPGMAKGGSGDVLTGLITGILAQGYNPDHAALIGVYLHGSAGDITATEIGMDGMTAMDLVNAIPKAWVQLRKNKSEV